MFSSLLSARTALLCAPLLLAAASPSPGVSEAPTVAERTEATKARKGKKAKKGRKGKAKKGGKQTARGLCAHLACTADQAERITARLGKLRQQRRDARKGQLSLQTALSREVAKEAPSKKELSRIRKELAAMHTKTSDATLDALLDIHAISNPEQRKALAEMVERHGLRRMMKGGPRQGTRRPFVAAPN